MAYEEYVVLEDRADGTGDTLEVSIHQTEDKAIEVCNKRNKQTGIFHEVMWIQREKRRSMDILDVDYTYSIGERV